MSESSPTPPDERPLAPAPPPAAVPRPKGDKPSKAAVRAAALSRPRRGPIVVAPSHSKRDAFIAIACGAAVLVLIALGLMVLHGEQGKPSTNQVTGIIVAKHASGEQENEISLGRKGLKKQQVDSGFSFDIKVEGRDEPYEVPVNEGLYRARKVGDKQSFIRPPSEQR